MARAIDDREGPNEHAPEALCLRRANDLEWTGYFELKIRLVP